MTRLSKRDERRGVLGSAGFPTSSGAPYGQIKNEWYFRVFLRIKH